MLYSGNAGTVSFLVSFLIRAPTPSQETHSLTSSKPNYLPKAPSPNTINIGCWCFNMNFGKTQFSSLQQLSMSLTGWVGEHNYFPQEVDREGIKDSLSWYSISKEGRLQQESFLLEILMITSGRRQMGPG